MSWLFALIKCEFWHPTSARPGCRRCGRVNVCFRVVVPPSRRPNKREYIGLDRLFTTTSESEIIRKNAGITRIPAFLNLVAGGRFELPTFGLWELGWNAVLFANLFPFSARWYRKCLRNWGIRIFLRKRGGGCGRSNRPLGFSEKPTTILR